MFQRPLRRIEYSVLNRTYGWYSRCCDDDEYDIRSQICCPDGTIRNRIYGWYSRCCEDDVYDRRLHICCSGTIHNMTYGLYTRCCGNVTYRFDIFIFTDRLSTGGNAISSVRPSVHPSTRFHFIFRTDWPLTLMFCMCGVTEGLR